MKDFSRFDRMANLFMLVFFLFMVTSASHFGFFNKWGLRDSDPQKPFTIERMLDGTADKPFVYRQLVPALAHIADAVVPKSLQKKIIEKIPLFKYYSPEVALSERDGLAFKYRVVFGLSFAGLFLSLVLLRQILVNAGLENRASLFAVAIFALAFPYIETNGGYYYDSVELAFFALSCFLLQKKQYYLFLLLVIPATLNKESFLVFILALVPFLFRHEVSKKTLLVFLAALLLALATNLYIKHLYSANEGGVVHFWLWRNLTAYLNPLTYLQREWTYGLISPGGASVFLLFPLFYMLKKSWLYIPGVFKFHAIMAALTNVPLAILFGHTGELRNFSFLHITVVVILATYIQFCMQREPRQARVSDG